MTATLRFAFLFVLLGSGCGSGVSAPVPQPVPLYMRASTPVESHQETLVVGLPQAVAGTGKVHVRDQLSGTSVAVGSAPDGSFSALIAVGQGAILEVRFENQDGLSEPVSLAVRAIGPRPVLGASKGPGPVSAPDPSGLVTVTNDAGPAQAPLFTATPLVEVLVSNVDVPAVVRATTDKDGKFSVRIVGSSKQRVQVLLADPTNRGLTSDFLSFTVP